VGKGVSAVGQSGITNSVAEGTFVSGYPAIENKEWLKSSVIFRKLPQLKKKIADLEARIAELEATLSRKGSGSFLSRGARNHRKKRPTP
jgi:UDP-3-O-[3-hydroxymyristoyl] glucosamine N-acyltransferase